MDYIHYIARRVAMTPSSSEAKIDIRIGLHDDSGGFSLPEYHQTRMRSWPTPQIGRGDTIWLISQLTSPWGILPPALDARIDVGSVSCCDAGITQFNAKKSSVWYILADSSRYFENLHVVSHDGKPRSLLTDLRPSVGQALQSIHLLLPEDGLMLRTHADAIAESPFDFVSYRHVDGTKLAFGLVRELLASGTTVYWDRWSLPRRLIERRELVNNSTLTRHLHKKIRASQRVWGIMSDTYLDPTKYAAKEMRVAMATNKFLPW